MLENWFENILLVHFEGLRLDLGKDLRILGEHTAVKKLLRKGKALYVFMLRHVDELTLAIAYDVMVTDKLGSTLLLRNDKLIIVVAIGDQTEPNTHNALGEEVHFWHLFFLIVNDLVFFGV